MVEVGFSWTRAKVEAIENGRRRVTIGELVGLAMMFGVRVEELVRTNRPWVRIGEASAVTSRALGGIFKGRNPRSFDLTDYDFPANRQAKVSIRPAFELAVRGELEGLMRRRFGIEAADLVKAAVALWGRMPSDERDARAQSRPRAKQWISRDLMNELSTYLETET